MYDDIEDNNTENGMNEGGESTRNEQTGQTPRAEQPLNGISFEAYHNGGGYHAYITSDDTDECGRIIWASEAL